MLDTDVIDAATAMAPEAVCSSARAALRMFLMP
jgi:hypothetical protein